MSLPARDIIELIPPTPQSEFGVPEHAEQLSLTLVSPNHDHILLERKESEQQILDMQKELVASQIKARISEIKAIISQMPNSEGQVDAQLMALEVAAGNLENFLDEVMSATSVMALSQAMQSLPNVLDAANLIVTSSKNEGALQGGVLMAEKVQEYFEQYTEAFRREVAAFNGYVDEHGFAAAWDQFDVSYDNMGVAHAHLLQNDAEYARTIIEIDERAEERKKAADADWEKLEKIAAENGISIEDARKRLADIDAQIAEARANGEDATVRDLEAQREQFIGQTANDLHDQTQDPAAAEVASNADARWEAAMREREEAHRAFIRAAQAAGATEQQLAQYQKDYEDRTIALENGELELSDAINADVNTHERELDRLAEQPEQNVAGNHDLGDPTPEASEVVAVVSTNPANPFAQPAPAAPAVSSGNPMAGIVNPAEYPTLAAEDVGEEEAKDNPQSGVTLAVLDGKAKDSGQSIA